MIIKSVLFTSFIGGYLLIFILLGSNCFKAEFGESCNTTQPCRLDFDCVAERCQCRYPDHQSYDRETDQCVSLVQGPCADTLLNGTVVEYGCVENSECQDVNEFRECRCKAGFVQNSRRCLAAFGEPCNVNGDCYNEPNNTVICIHHRCGCASLQILDENRKKCRGLVGAKCGDSERDPECIDGAACMKYDATNGICRCTGDHATTPERRCVVQQC